MIGFLLFFLVAMTSFAGFTLFAASQRQHRAAIARALPIIAASPRLQRWAGASFLAASMALAFLRDGPAFGLVVWALTVSYTAFLVAALLAWLSKR